jgi:hypothetical protein
MKKIILSALFLLTLAGSISAQGSKEEKDEEKKGFKKENLFTGGSINLAFYSNTFAAGGSPVFGYSLTNWLDAGVVVNYNYTSYRDYQGYLNDKLHQTNYGGGAFLRIYPVRFIFLQAQEEHNFLKEKYMPAGGGLSTINKYQSNSTLIGGGYTTGRYGRGGAPFYYLSVLFDVSGDANSPYTDSYGRSIPIIRGGIQVPLFQGQQGRGR